MHGEIEVRLRKLLCCWHFLSMAQVGSSSELPIGSSELLPETVSTGDRSLIGEISRESLGSAGS